jgi:hypothetical protein
MPARSSNVVERIIPPSAIRAVQISAVRVKPRERRLDGPFSRLGTAADPGNLPAEGERRGGQVVVVHGSLPDPNPVRAGKRQRVALNAHRDALYNDLKYRRINHDQYAAGVTYRVMLELSHGMPKGNAAEYLQPTGGNKVNGQALRMVALIEQGENCALFFKQTCKVVGMTGARILELVLIGTGDGDGPKTFPEVAQIMGMVARQPREVDSSYEKRSSIEGQKIGWAFRDALKLLASKWQYGDAPKLPEPRKWGR